MGLIRGRAASQGALCGVFCVPPRMASAHTASAAAWRSPEPCTTPQARYVACTTVLPRWVACVGPPGGGAATNRWHQFSHTRTRPEPPRQHLLPSQRFTQTMAPMSTSCDAQRRWVALGRSPDRRNRCRTHSHTPSCLPAARLPPPRGLNEVWGHKGPVCNAFEFAPRTQGW
jgi:hypothetical protein